MRPVSFSPAPYFVFMGKEGRVRRPRDVVSVVIGLILILWAVIARDSLPEWVSTFTVLIASSPQWVQVLLGIGYLVSLLYAVWVTVALMLRGPDRGPAIRDLLLVMVVSTGLAVLLSWLVNGAWPYVFPEIDLQNATPRFPVTRVALVTGILLVVSAYVTRPLRRLGWVAMITTALAAIGLGYGTPIHVVGSFGIGLLSAGMLLVLVGTPRGYPAPEAIAYGLQRLGVGSVERITPFAEQNWGLVRFAAEIEPGRTIEVKAYGRDAFDSQLAAKAWRTLMYRELGRTVSFSRLQAVEHEALVNLMAKRAGVSVHDLVAVGSASAELALIAFESGGQRLQDLDGSTISDEVLVSLWRNVQTTHDANISHGALSTAAVRVDDEGPVLVDFGLGSLASRLDDRAGDVVELLFTLALLVGPERAVRSALEGMGSQALIDALPYLQVPAVSSSSRRGVKKPKEVVTALEDQLVAATGTDKPKPAEIRRVTPRNLLMTGLLLLAAYALIPLLTRVDYAAIWDVLDSAEWPLIMVALIVGHTQFFPQATSTMFAVPVALPFWPLLTLQTASQFISLAIPSSAGRVAMNAAFLRKFGMSLTEALAMGAIDGFSGFLVQFLILIVILLTGNIDLGLELDMSDVPWLLVLGITVLVVVGVVIAVLRVAKLRERILPIVSQAWDALRGVLRQPVRAMGLLGSSFVYWNLLGLTLWMLLGAVGAPIGYGAALFVATGTSLLAGLMPVPGGVGVAEATMIALLATFGVEDAAAIAVTAVFRVITFYLPALEGLFGTRWLERNDYV